MYDPVDIKPDQVELLDPVDINPKEIIALPFELPASLKGLESLIYDYMLDGAKGCDQDEPGFWESTERYAIAVVERRIAGYHALGQIATNPNSLPYRLVHMNRSS